MCNFIHGCKRMWAVSRFGIKAWLVLKIELNIKELKDHGIIKTSWKRSQEVPSNHLLRAGSARGKKQATQDILSSQVFTAFSDSDSTGFLSELYHCWSFLTRKKLPPIPNLNFCYINLCLLYFTLSPNPLWKVQAPSPLEPPTGTWAPAGSPQNPLCSKL